MAEWEAGALKMQQKHPGSFSSTESPRRDGPAPRSGVSSRAAPGLAACSALACY